MSQFSSKTDHSMYNHAKMGRIQDLKKRLYALIAKDPHGEGDDVLDTNVKGLGEPATHAADKMPAMVDGDDEFTETPDAGEHPDDMDPLAQMAREFKPKAKARRPGTAMMIASAVKAPTSKTNHPYGAKGKHKGGF